MRVAEAVRQSGRVAGALDRTIPVQIFGRHIVLRHFSCVNFSHVRVGRIFHAFNHFSLEGLSLLDQFLDAFRVSLLDVRQSLRVPRLAG